MVNLMYVKAHATKLISLEISSSPVILVSGLYFIIYLLSFNFKINHQKYLFYLSIFKHYCHRCFFSNPKWEVKESVTQARRGQWPRTPPVYLNEVLGSAPPPGQGRWTSVWRGGLGSATSRGIDRIKLDLSEINTKERRATHTSRWGRGCDTRRRNISWRKHKTWTFFLCLFIFQTKKGHGGFFFSSKWRY